MFRVRDLDSGYWVVKGNDGEIAPTAEHRKDATIFEGVAWVRYWGEAEGVEIVPLAEDEVMARLGAPRLPGFEEE